MIIDKKNLDRIHCQIWNEFIEMDEANQAKVIKEIEEEEKKNATKVTNKQGTSKKIMKNDKEELRKRNVLKPINYSYFINQIVRSPCFLSRGLFPAP